MGREAVGSVAGIQVQHELVARHLGDDRRRGDREGERVAVNQADLRGTVLDGARIKEDHLRQQAESGDRAFHGQAIGGRKPDQVELPTGDGADRYVESNGLDPPGEPRSLQWVETLGVADATERRSKGAERRTFAGGQDNRRREERSGEGTAPYFVYTGNDVEAGTPEAALVG